MNAAKIDWLFETEALKFAPADSPFWYTSGLIGPYYINTHFLCGGESKAKELLAWIDSAAVDFPSFGPQLLAKLKAVSLSYPIYCEVVKSLAAKAEAIDGVQYVSGGQRRDWFFAPLVAEKCGLPLLLIYNDKSVMSLQGERVSDLKGGGVLNVADLLTVGSSYTAKWVPALQEVNGSLTASLNVVDRLQGGKDNLAKAGVKHCSSLFEIDHPFFDAALSAGYIDERQFQLATSYLEDPHASMRSFLIENPQFLRAALQSPDNKTKGRAEQLLSGDLYKLPQLDL